MNNLVQKQNIKREVSADSSFEDIYKEYGQRILNLSYKMLRNEETARDLTQEIFIKVYLNKESFKKESNIYTWIYRIALNHILNFLKKNSRRNLMSIEEKKTINELNKDKVHSINNDNPTPIEIINKSEREKTIWNAINSLPAKYRVPFILHKYEEKEQKDIAELMGISVSAVETRVHRAKKQLIKILEPVLDKI